MSGHNHCFAELQIKNFMLFLQLYGVVEVRKFAEKYPDRFYQIYFAACEYFSKKNDDKNMGILRCLN